MIADHGAFNATAQPTRYPAGFFSVFTGSYDVEAAHCAVTGVYTNKAPGGVAYACSFRIAEAVYLVERCVDCMARELELDPGRAAAAEPDPPGPVPVRVEDRLGLRLRQLRGGAAARRWSSADYDALRAEQAEKRARGELMGIGVSFFTEAVGAGPRKHMDMFGLAMNDGATLRISPTGIGPARDQRADAGPGARDDVRADRQRTSSGSRVDDVDVVHGDTDTTPYGLGTYGSRSTPVSGAATAIAARKVRDRARIVAAAMLEVAPEDLEWRDRPLVGQGRSVARRVDRARSRWPRAVRSTCPRASRPASTPRPSTTRRT